MFLHGFTMITQATKENKEAFSKVPFYSFLPVQRFQSELVDKYCPERFEQIKKISFAHKLSFKSRVLNKKNKDIENTFLEKVINGELS